MNEWGESMNETDNSNKEYRWSHRAIEKAAKIANAASNNRGNKK
jgi:hypothetical protein